MSQYFLNKYTALAIAVQFVVIALVWILSLAISPVGDRYLDLMFYLYVPAMALVSILFNPKGELGAAMLGLPCGIVIYGLLFGLAISYLKRHRRESGK
ncbi:MAG TPA: hypothetical protein VK208_15070 [Pyrinomonadaceae bacterium]|nr:hypothetical protein [Pyrinomonadaceae bacterium]